jgi:hypothetical protein
VSDFDTDTLTDDWNNVLASGGPLSFTCNGVTASGIWAAQYNQLTDAEEQLRDERRFTIFTTVTSAVTVPAVRNTVVRDSVTYFIESVRQDAESVGIELDVKAIF